MVDNTPWSHTFDFTKSDGGGVAAHSVPDDGIPRSAYITGYGWSSVNINYTNLVCNQFDIIVPNPTTITSFTITYDFSQMHSPVYFNSGLYNYAASYAPGPNVGTSQVAT